MPWLKDRWAKAAEAEKAAELRKAKDEPVNRGRLPFANGDVDAPFEPQRRGGPEVEGDTTWDLAARLAEAQAENEKLREFLASKGLLQSKL